MTDPTAPAPAVDDDVSDPSALDFALLRQYRELREAQNISEAEGKAYKEEADAIQERLIEMFADAGMQNINIDGKTIYLHRSVYAARCAGVTTEDVMAALLEADAGDLIKPTVNANTLSAWVRELTDDDDAPGLPEPVVGVLEPGERFSVRIIAGGTGKKTRTKK